MLCLTRILIWFFSIYFQMNFWEKMVNIVWQPFIPYNVFLMSLTLSLSSHRWHPLALPSPDMCSSAFLILFFRYWSLLYHDLIIFPSSFLFFIIPFSFFILCHSFHINVAFVLQMSLKFHYDWWDDES